jgi:hypothetical protein
MYSCFYFVLLPFKFHGGHMESRSRVITRYLRIPETPDTNVNSETGHTFPLVSLYPQNRCPYSAKSCNMKCSAIVPSNSQPIDHPTLVTS